jgi:HAD superfamily hydrolase (TIGR01509 family)
MSPPLAVLFDFNGTLSNDEEVLFGIYAGLLAEAGRPLTHAEYFSQLVGQTDARLFRLWLGPEAPVEELTEARIDRYRHAVLDGSTVPPGARAAVAGAAADAPVGIVTSAFRRELEPVLAATGLDRLVTTIVCADDVTRHKPDPEPYDLACRLLGVTPGSALAIEDTPAGVASAKAAGLRVAALVGTVTAARLAGADVLLRSLDELAAARLVLAT